KYGSSDLGGGENIVFDFSSPNIAKPFGVGHLRSTAIGNSLYRVYDKLGYKSVGINHLGDWGTQFGKLIVAFRLWGNEDELKNNPIQKLFELYVKFHKEEKNDPVLTEQAREAFKDLEDGNQEAATLWAKFKEYSLASFNETYELLGVKFDYLTGESFYNDKMDQAIEVIEKAGLTEISQEALIVNLDKYKLPPCLLRKGDGATLYATRDLAGIFYRWKTFNFAKALYIVGSAQKDHFRQVFKVIEMLDEVNQNSPKDSLAPRLQHVGFGWIKFKDQMMSTREGNIILLEEVLNKAIALAKEKINEKNPNLKELDKTAQQIGVGAVIYADLSTRKEKDVNFDWNQVLNFEGESGPYLQYTHARLSSLIRNYGREISNSIDYSLLDKPEEAQVIDLLYKFPQVIWSVSEHNEPFLITTYLLELASSFNKVYQRKDSSGRIDKIISDDAGLTDARISLVSTVRIVINEGLYLLGIDAPEEM
ncbi:MAG: arginine--tRNA ligase, partial [candidate division Zixibacteria bacterium]|nr:arginine--tRNA ligase [candidate division Zixibacteria bacterium]